MGRRAKRIAAGKTAAAKSNAPSASLTEAVQRTEKTSVISLASKLPEQRRSGAGRTEFYRAAELFGIAGDNPKEEEFIHPSKVRTTVEVSDNVIFKAMSAAICDVLAARHDRFWGRKPGSVQLWTDECETLRQYTLGRLRHRRKRDKHKANVASRVQAVENGPGMPQTHPGSDVIIDALD